jgi:hypothetical protein
VKDLDEWNANHMAMVLPARGPLLRRKDFIEKRDHVPRTRVATSVQGDGGAFKAMSNWSETPTSRAGLII